MNGMTLGDRVLAAYYRRKLRGFHALYRLAGKQSILAQTRYGSVFALDPYEYIDGIVLHEGYYESEVFDALRPYLRPGVVFWDVGACFGLHAVTAKLIAPELEVHAFEPNPHSHLRLTANAAANGVDVHAWPYALGDCGGEGTLHHMASGNVGMSTLTPWDESRYDKTLTVKVVTAKSLIAAGEAPLPNVIKIDVEGGESLALAGFGDLLGHPQLRVIVLEGRADLHLSPEKDVLGRHLVGAGFHLRSLRRNEQTGHPLANFLAEKK
jgi:FkbM family methyltransferase